MKNSYNRLKFMPTTVSLLLLVTRKVFISAYLIQKATCSQSCNNGKCYNGTCRCWEPYTGATCSELSASALPLPLNSYNLDGYKRVYAYYTSSGLGTANLFFSLSGVPYGSFQVHIFMNLIIRFSYQRIVRL